MPDPAEIIAGTISDPPPRGDLADSMWPYQSVMSMPGGRDLARHIAGAAVEALAAAGWKIVPGTHADPAALPSLAQMYQWLEAHDWTPATSGPAGAVWYPPTGARPVGIPDDADPDRIAGAVQRVAQRMGMPLVRVLAEMINGG